MRRSFLLIHNPLAGRRGNRLVLRVIGELSRRGASVTLIKESSVKAALSAISSLMGTSRYDGVVVAGGDGTVRAVAKQLALRKIVMGLIPAGTGNVLAFETCLPFEPAQIAETLIFGPEVEIGGSAINGQPFFLMAGVGFDGDVIAKLDLATKQRVGKLSYVWPLASALRTRPVALEVTIDGTMYEGSWVIATRARHYAGSFDLAAEADMRRPGLIAVVFEGLSRRRRFMELAALASGRLERLAGVKRISCEQITITSDRPVLVQADGDPVGATPVEISTGHTPLRLIVPRGYAKFENRLKRER